MRLIWEVSAPRFAHPFAAPEPSTASVSAGNSAFTDPDFEDQLGRSDEVCLATFPAPRSRCVRSISASQHSTYEYPYSPALGSIVPTAVPRDGVYVTGCAHYDQGIERFTTFEALRGSPEFIGALSASRTRIWRFSWPFAATFPLTPLSPPHTRPVHLPLSRRCTLRLGAARSFPLRRRDANRRFRDPRCLPSAGDSRLL